MSDFRVSRQQSTERVGRLDPIVSIRDVGGRNAIWMRYFDPETDDPSGGADAVNLLRSDGGLLGIRQLPPAEDWIEVPVWERHRVHVADDPRVL